MIRRAFNFILIGLAIIGAVVTYNMKHKAEVAAEHVARLQANIAKEKDAITLLKAEWSVLTQPGRLQEVVQAYADHFQLVPFSPQQIARIEDIPLRATPANAQPAGGSSDPLAALLTGRTLR